ncbi:Cell pattern formation-associated protein stuA [Exophiala dermatitidis]
MNQTQSYMDMHSASHMSSGPSYSHPAGTAPLGHYQQYQQPPIIPPASTHYGPPQAYGNYGYANGVTSPQSAAGHVSQQVQSQMPSLPAMMPGPSPQQTYVPQTSSLPAPAQGYPPAPPIPFDTTGQIAPPGMKPRVTATLWEDEGSLCFQVEAKGVCVARREDNHFINGTKLLNVAGMTRGRRDGILKSEKTRHVVKIGPMHLKGVWIPFERALEFANKEKITDLLYPLFVHNIGGLLYNPENAPRTNAVVQATERRRMDSIDAPRSSQPSQTPSLPLHSTMSGSGQAPPTPHSVAQHANTQRPGIDRAHTFPTPPTSASSVMGMTNQGSSYDWNNQGLANGTAGTQPLSIDTGGINARSMPTTPATTPPGTAGQGMHHYQSQSSYDNSKHYYSTTPSSQTGYAQHPDGSRYGQHMQAVGYGKSDMGPPIAPGSGSGGGDGHDHKTDTYPGQNHSSQHEGDHTDGGYMNANASAYNANRGHYAYGAPGDHSHLSPEQMSGSPTHQAGSGHATPRTMPSGQPQWTPDYHTPPNRAPPSSNVYNIMGRARTPQGGSADGYGNSTYSSRGHAGAMSSAKRGREDDDQDRPSSRDYDGYDSKRRKMGRQETFGMPLNPPPHMQAIKSGGQR